MILFSGGSFPVLRHAEDPALRPAGMDGFQYKAQLPGEPGLLPVSPGVLAPFTTSPPPHTPLSASSLVQVFPIPGILIPFQPTPLSTGRHLLACVLKVGSGITLVGSLSDPLPPPPATARPRKQRPSLLSQSLPLESVCGGAQSAEISLGGQGPCHRREQSQVKA